MTIYSENALTFWVIGKTFESLASSTCVDVETPECSYGCNTASTASCQALCDYNPTEHGDCKCLNNDCMTCGPGTKFEYPDSEYCSDINECQGHNDCEWDQACENVFGSYECK